MDLLATDLSDYRRDGAAQCAGVAKEGGRAAAPVSSDWATDCESKNSAWAFADKFYCARVERLRFAVSRFSARLVARQRIPAAHHSSRRGHHHAACRRVPSRVSRALKGWTEVGERHAAEDQGCARRRWKLHVLPRHQSHKAKDRALWLCRKG